MLESLRWLGLDWDEGPDVGGPHGPYRQSQRDRHLPRARRAADRRGTRVSLLLHARGAGGAIKQAAIARGEPPGYDGRCRPADATRNAAAFEAEGRPCAIRFAMPEREWVVDDLVKGEVRFPAGQLRDFVLVRSDGSPVFLLAVAVDDLLMGITHVIRGDDLLASAPRNAAVIEALGGTPPAYAHLPQVLGMDGKPLSKRHGSTSVEAFREQGFLPEALMNYLALLGWSKDESTTFLSRDELDRGVRPVPRLQQPGRVRHAEARVDEQPLHPVARRRRARRTVPALPDRGRTAAGPRRCCARRCRSCANA